MTFSNKKLFTGRLQMGMGQRFIKQHHWKRAQQILQSGKLTWIEGKAFKPVYAWNVQPTLKQVQYSGARFSETVIKFNIRASFEMDTTVTKSLQPFALRSSFNPPLKVTNTQIVGFKPAWWQFWK